MTLRRSANNAILVLEQPWGLDDSDSNRTSVLPFIEGIAKLAGDTEVFHANFYDKSSFTKAIEYLCKIRFQNTSVYVAAHGYKKKAGGVNIIDLLVEIGSYSKKHNITGVMLGSCYVGEHTTEMGLCIEGTNLKWCAGYSSESAWLAGTMIDCCVIDAMTRHGTDIFSDREVMISYFADALSHFSPSFNIGYNYKRQPVRLDDSLQFVIQPSGQGQRATLVSQEVFDKHKKYQI